MTTPEMTHGKIGGFFIGGQDPVGADHAEHLGGGVMVPGLRAEGAILRTRPALGVDDGTKAEPVSEVVLSEQGGACQDFRNFIGVAPQHIEGRFPGDRDSKFRRMPQVPDVQMAHFQCSSMQVESQVESAGVPFRNRDGVLPDRCLARSGTVPAAAIIPERTMLSIVR